jgi:hypothetical protein
VIQPIGDGGGRRLIDQTQHLETRHLGGILGGLTLRIVEIGRHGDDGAIEQVVKTILGALSQHGQQLGGNLHRRLQAFARLHLQHAHAVLDAIGQLGGLRQIGQTTSHQALDRCDGVGGILGRR